jgi:hypothetical protein
MLGALGLRTGDAHHDQEAALRIRGAGAMGGSEDTPIHQALAWGRLLRIGDGPDEVHLRQIFRMEAMPSWSIAESPYLAAHPA